MRDLKVGGSFDGSNDVVEMVKPVPFDMETPVAFSMRINCHSGTPCPSGSDDPHFMLNLWVRNMECNRYLYPLYDG